MDFTKEAATKVREETIHTLNVVAVAYVFVVVIAILVLHLLDVLVSMFTDVGGIIGVVCVFLLGLIVCLQPLMLLCDRGPKPLFGEGGTANEVFDDKSGDEEEGESVPFSPSNKRAIKSEGFDDSGDDNAL